MQINCTPSPHYLVAHAYFNWPGKGVEKPVVKHGNSQNLMGAFDPLQPMDLPASTTALQRLLSAATGSWVRCAWHEAVIGTAGSEAT